MDKDLEEIITYKKKYGNDNIQYKEIIKQKIINNNKLIKAINNKKLDPENPDDYLGDNFLPYYLITDTVQEVKHFVCYETSFTSIVKQNRIYKYGQIIFYILCHNQDIYDKASGIARHDLIAALIEDDFNWCTDFGMRLELIEDKPYAVDNAFILRTLIFEQQTPNGIVDANLGSIINNDR